MNGLDWAPIVLSLQVASVATLCALPPAVAVAWLLSRGRFRGRLLLESLVMAPLVLPPLVTGYFLLLLFGTGGPLGGWLLDVFGIRIAFTWVGAAIAAGVLAFPLMVRSIQLGFESIDPRLQGMARTLGARWFDSFFSVMLPLAWPSIASAVLIGFARGLGEFGATIILAGNLPGKTQTVPLAIYTAINTPGGERRALLLAGISVAFGVFALVVSHIQSGRAQEGAQER